MVIFQYNLYIFGYNTTVANRVFALDSSNNGDRDVYSNPLFGNYYLILWHSYHTHMLRPSLEVFYHLQLVVDMVSEILIKSETERFGWSFTAKSTLFMSYWASETESMPGNISLTKLKIRS